VKLISSLLAAVLGLITFSNHVEAGLGDELFKLTASDASQFSSFGHAVSMSGNWAVVGPLRHDGAGIFAGSAYVYDVSSGQEIWQLSAPDASPLDNFGQSVAASGRLAVIGSPGDDDNCLEPNCNTGSAYLFDMVSGQQLFKFVSSQPAENQEFGFSVAMSGSRALVGAFQDEDPALDDILYNSGSAYLFDTSTGQQLMRLTAADAARRDHFGRAVGLNENVALIGAPSDDDAGEMSGSAYLFDVATGQELTKLTAADAGAGHNFGHAVAIDGNLAVIGAPGDNGAGGRSGSAYIFDINSGQQLFKLTASDGGELDNFGRSVAIHGNMVTVGAPLHDNTGSFQGSVYLFDASTGQQLFKFTADEGDQFDKFGDAVAISGNTALFGVSGDDDACAGAGICDAGAAFVFDIGMPLYGDTNGDGLVDLEDLNNVRAHFGSTGPDNGTLPGDTVAFDGIVDLTDLNNVRNNFGTGASPVPEPTALLLAAASIVCVLAPFRRRAK